MSRRRMFHKWDPSPRRSIDSNACTPQVSQIGSVPQIEPSEIVLGIEDHARVDRFLQQLAPALDGHRPRIEPEDRAVKRELALARAGRRGGAQCLEREVPARDLREL